LLAYGNIPVRGADPHAAALLRVSNAVNSEYFNKIGSTIEKTQQFISWSD
jgi:hypothetical protein